MDKLIITVALIGNVTSREKSPHPPMTPKEIAESAIESFHAGAAAEKAKGGGLKLFK